MRPASLLLVTLLTALPANRLHAEEVTIKLGTLAPNGSAWHTLLKEMGQKWSEMSGGRVKLRIYPGGVVGNEGDMVKKIRVGQLQAAALTTIGLHEITPEPQAIDVPLLIDSFATLDSVMETLGPKMEQALDAKGFIVLQWSEVGFVRFFSTKPYRTFQEMKQAKVFAWEGDPASVDAWRAAGFHPVVISSTDLIPSLQTGMIDTVALAPLYAYTSRVFERAKYMLDLAWAVLTGATVLKKETWEQVPADLRPKLLEVARSYEKRVQTEVRRMDAAALDNMKKQGLQVIPVGPAEHAAFERAAQASYSIIRGRVVPAAFFDEVKHAVDQTHQKGKR